MTNTTDTPTIVLVHGGFADASFWVPVIRELQAGDLPVVAPANPLRGLAHDAEYVASVVRQIDGPVLLVGHSYGGAVISVAGLELPDDGDPERGIGEAAVHEDDGGSVGGVRHYRSFHG